MGDGREPNDAERNLAAHGLLADGASKTRPFRLSDNEYAYLIDGLLEHEFLEPSSLAERLPDLRARGLNETADAIVKHVKEDKPVDASDDPRKYIAGPKIRELIEGGDYVAALDLAASFGEEDETKLVADTMSQPPRYFGLPVSPERRLKFLSAVAAKSPALAFHAIARNINTISEDGALIELAFRQLPKLGGTAGSVAPAVVDLRMNYLYRHPNVETLTQDVFDSPNPFLRVESSYLLMRSLAGHV